MDDGPCSNLVYPVANITDYVLFTFGERCLPYSIVLPTVIVYVLIFLAGVFGNVCTCTVIAYCTSMHNTTNYYLFSLAISDLLILLIGLPMELHDVLGSIYPYKFGSVICKLRAFLVEFTSYASILIISAFTTERWLAICFPLQIRHFSSMSRAFKVIPIAWSIAFAAALPMAFVVKVNRLALPTSAINSSWAHLVSNDGETIINTEFCAMDVNNPFAQKFLIYFAFAAFFLLPAILITVAYFFIGIKLRQTDQYMKGDEQSCMGKSAVQKNSIIKVLASIVIVFFLSWLPFHMQRLLSVFLLETDGDVGDVLHIIFTSVFYISGRKRSAQMLSFADTAVMRKNNIFQKQVMCREVSSRFVLIVFPVYEIQMLTDVCVRSGLEISDDSYPLFFHSIGRPKKTERTICEMGDSSFRKTYL